MIFKRTFLSIAFYVILLIPLVHRIYSFEYSAGWNISIVLTILLALVLIGFITRIISLPYIKITKEKFTIYKELSSKEFQFSEIKKLTDNSYFGNIVSIHLNNGDIVKINLSYLNSENRNKLNEILLKRTNSSIES